MALLIAPLHGIEVERQIAAEARVATVVLPAVKLARAIDLAAREIAATAEIVLVAAMWEVPGIVAPSEIVAATAAVMPAQVATGVPPAWAVRVVDLAEAEGEPVVAEAEPVVAAAVAEVVAEVVAAGVAAAAAGGDGKVICLRQAM